MAGHSKWANIKHRKAAQDSKKGKIFTKIIRELVVAAKSGSTIEDNPKLRQVIDKALNANMTRDTINRAIARGAVGGDDTNMEEITYEGYAPGGIAILIETLTDNKNRTVAEIRHAFSKHGGNLGTDGSVSYLFKKNGQLFYDATDVNEETLYDLAIEFGALDVIQHDDDSIEILTYWTELLSIKDKMIQKGLIPKFSEVSMIADINIDLDQEASEKLIKLIEWLDDLDDVQNVYTNANLSIQ